MDATKLTHDDYTVAWICPLEVEQIAAMEMLDKEHERLPQSPNDHNAYALGSVFGHNVVIAGLPAPGNASAATVVAQMRSTFRHLRFGLLVGIGGGVPISTDEGPIRLGHVVVSEPTGQHSGAVQYDHGKAEGTGDFRRTGVLAPPPKVLLNAARRMGVKRKRAKEDPLVEHLKRIKTSRRGLRMYKRPGADTDHLYEPNYEHLDRNASCQKCGCDPEKRVQRRTGDSDEEKGAQDAEAWIVVHRGTIASGEKVMRNAVERDRLTREHGILCFEMEAAGALNDFPCLVIRGISDYSDSHKNDKWHGYAAATAAAYARELFMHMPIDEVKQCRIAESDVKEMISNTQTIVRNNQEANIQQWLDPPDPSTNHERARDMHHNGTGAWFLDSAEYTQWKARSVQALWLHGIPGCGKTILSSTLIHDLQCSKSPQAVVIFFYFDFNDSSKQTFKKMLQSLTFQLYKQVEGSRQYLDELMQDSKNGGQPQRQVLESVFIRMVHAAGNVRIVLDALDECTTRSELLYWLRTSTSRQSCFILTSRKEQDIENSLIAWTTSVSIQQAPVDEDIRAFVRDRLVNDPELLRWKTSPELREMIETKLMQKAQGMFRWAACQLDALRECLDRPSLIQALQSLPEGLDQTYDRILLNILPRYRQHAVRILQFLLYSGMPLRLEEAVDIIAVEPESNPGFDERNRMPEPLEIARYCGSLTQITRSTVDYKFIKIELAHFSVQEYLLSDRVSELFKADLSALRANVCIVTVSLTYLFEALEAPDAKFPFRSYAAKYWMKHAKSAEGESKTVQELIWKLFRDDKLFSNWHGQYDRYDAGMLELKPATSSKLYCAAKGGLALTFKRLLSSSDVSKLGAHGDGWFRKFTYADFLVAASLHGHIEIVQLLLDREVEANVMDFYERTALLEASEGGHLEIVRLLLDKGADVDVVGLYGTALQKASGGGHLEIVQLLLDKGADVYKTHYRSRTALQRASGGGHLEIVQLLLDRGADVDVVGPHKAALKRASYQNHPEIVQLFLD